MPKPSAETRIEWSAVNDLTDWSGKGVGSIEQPFNLQRILEADADLLACWKHRPFYLTKAADGSLLVRFMDEDVFGKGHTA